MALYDETGHQYPDGTPVKVGDVVAQAGIDYRGIVMYGINEFFVMVAWVKWDPKYEGPMYVNENPFRLVKVR